MEEQHGSGEQHAHHYEHRKGPLEKIPLPLLVAGVGVICLIAGYAIAAFAMSPAKPVTASPTPGATAAELSALESKVSTYLTQMIALQGATAGITVEVANATDYKGMYAMDIAVVSSGQILQTGKAYASKDGTTLIIGNEFDLNTPLPTPSPVPSPSPAPRLARPEAQIFVMSFCPYGIQAEQGLSPVARILGSNMTIEPHFVVYSSDYYNGSEAQYCFGNTTYCSMHGVNEITEDARQLCILRDYNKTTWWNYVDYVNANCSVSTIETCWKQAAAAAQVNTTKVETCVATDGARLLESEKTLDDSLGVTSSPTIRLNGVAYAGGRSPEAFKTAFCDAFTVQPAACSMTLSQAEATASGSCG